ncbi:hypothetical protein OSG_eHP36_00095 [environmental Halophage eHP-36]|jgi:hypothetical protein|nr:hypothetical protein OSG_eHP36_00095 [environmental Halophage eHP-36]
MIHIKTDTNGRIKTINYQTVSGADWISLPDGSIPEVSESDVAVSYYYDSDTEAVSVETEPLPDDDLSP